MEILKNFPPDDLKSAANVKEIIPRLKEEVAENRRLIELLRRNPNGGYCVGLLRKMNSEINAAIAKASEYLFSP
jgi:hypothetical protein